MYRHLASLIFYVVGIVVHSQATDMAKYAVGAVHYQLGYVGVVLAW